jgi:protein gp37
MSNQTDIEWTEQTWNPTTGCTKISAGCKHCYAEVMAKRLKSMKAPGYENGFELSLVPKRLNQPLLRKKPTVYFVNSMSDLFHNGIEFSYLDRIFSVITQAKQHTFQVLTKRSERMVEYFTERPVPENVWLGVTVEDRQDGKARIDHLRQVNAKVRFLSCEPLLEDLGTLDLTGIHWVIVGGESGLHARPMNKEWVVSIKNQCDWSNTAFFFKQWGVWGVDGVKRHKKKNGRLLDGQTWSQYPEQQTMCF